MSEAGKESLRRYGIAPPAHTSTGLLSLKVVQGALLGTEEWPGGTPDTDPRPEEVARLRNEI